MPRRFGVNAVGASVVTTSAICKHINYDSDTVQLVRVSFRLPQLQRLRFWLHSVGSSVGTTSAIAKRLPLYALWLNAVGVVGPCAPEMAAAPSATDVVFQCID